jgi:hypothetical protein
MSGYRPLFSRKKSWRDGMPADPNDALACWRQAFYARERKELPYSRARGGIADNVVSFHREVFKMWMRQCEEEERREAAIEAQRNGRDGAA